LLFAATLVLTSCQQALTAEEAQQALEETALSSQALTVVGGTVEISTNFTIGKAVKQAAEELQKFITTQLPCAEITLIDNTLTVEYGAKSGNCTYYGQTYTGTHSITVTKNEQGDVVVDHQWTNLANQRMSVTGVATVTWSAASPNRHVVHELAWTRLSDNRQGVGSGDRVQQPLAGGWLEGIQVDGVRAWDGEAGHWDLDVDGVQMRWIDPVPQAGTYTLDTPFDKSADLQFERVDGDTIRVTISSGNREFSFLVSKLGLITRE